MPCACMKTPLCGSKIQELDLVVVCVMGAHSNGAWRRLECATELVTASDGSIVAMLGASPGASTASLDHASDN